VIETVKRLRELSPLYETAKATAPFSKEAEPGS
jgi:hypothetical protein